MRLPLLVTGPSQPRSSFFTVLLLLVAITLLSLWRFEKSLFKFLLLDPLPPSPPPPLAPHSVPTTTTTSPHQLFFASTHLPPAQRRHHHHHHRRPAHKASWFHACRPTKTTVWEEWRTCVEAHLPNTKKAFQDVLRTSRARRLWATSNATAVLLEFRAWPQELTFSVNNALLNLPVHWRLQIVGGPAIVALALQLYPMEIQAGKVVLTDLGFDDMAQTRISAVLTDLRFYAQLLGDQWLFFQYDSAICSPQRHLLSIFLAKPYGWWGAPWVHWKRLPHFCGNGGFSLRTRAFVTTILTKFPWVSQRVTNNEDWFICNKAADLYQANPSSALHATPWLVPAPKEEAMQFSVESIFHDKPFGVHQFWRDMHAPNTTALKSFFQVCPEALDVLPADVLERRPEWRPMLCEAGRQENEGWKGENGRRRFDYWQNCVALSSSKHA